MLMFLLFAAFYYILSIWVEQRIIRRLQPIDWEWFPNTSMQCHVNEAASLVVLYIWLLDVLGATHTCIRVTHDCLTGSRC